MAIFTRRERGALNSVPEKRCGPHPELHEEFERITGVLCPLLASGDRAGMARLLHEWEAYTVDKLKLRDIWEPTPFPLETG